MTHDEFYADEKRRLSTEVDFGVFWRKEIWFPTYRITWCEATGEVYACRMAIPVEDQYEVLGVVQGRTQVEEALKGWADACGELNSVEWVRARLS